MRLFSIFLSLSEYGDSDMEWLICVSLDQLVFRQRITRRVIDWARALKCDYNWDHMRKGLVKSTKSAFS